MVRIGIILIALSFAMAAHAADPESCDEQDFTDAAAMRLGQVSAAAHPHLLLDRQGCPNASPACRIGAALSPRQALLLSDKAEPGYVCAAAVLRKAVTAGWIDQRGVAQATTPIDANPPLAAWAGTWRLYDNRISLDIKDGTITAAAEAYWPGKNVMPANEGGFEGEAAPNGNRLHIVDGSDACTVDMVPAGPFLIVTDNRLCGGHNVSFSGIYTRRSAERRYGSFGIAVTITASPGRNRRR